MKTKALYSIFFAACIYFLSGCNGNKQSNEDKATENNTSGKSMNDTMNMDHSGHNMGSSEDSSMNLMAVMSKSMQAMKDVHMSGDPDHDFASMMIEHHTGAIEMCDIELKSGKDESIKSLAGKMKLAQTKDLNQLQAFTESHKAEGTHDHEKMAKDPFSMKMMKNMEAMDSKMKNMKMEGDVDKDFATMMIDHHKDGMEMAKAEIAYGKNKEMKSLAQKMIQDQQKDISELQNLLSKK
ncbi:MAG: DUF305 domain-containing protein [Cytophagaceae bacterium]|nr:DUF305 domain-containing protein [Cytophagaceae bacterium]